MSRRTWRPAHFALIFRVLFHMFNVPVHKWLSVRKHRCLVAEMLNAFCAGRWTPAFPWIGFWSTANRCAHRWIYACALFAQQIVYNGQVNNEIQFVLSEFIVWIFGVDTKRLAGRTVNAMCVCDRHGCVCVCVGGVPSAILAGNNQSSWPGHVWPMEKVCPRWTTFMRRTGLLMMVIVQRTAERRSEQTCRIRFCPASMYIWIRGFLFSNVLPGRPVKLVKHTAIKKEEEKHRMSESERTLWYENVFIGVTQ